VVLFNGGEKRLEFVTQAAPLPLQVPVAFTAVVLALDEDNEPGLVIRQRALPNRDAFTDGTVVMRDPSVTAMSFKFLSEDGQWVDTWDGQEAKTVPRAIQLRLGVNMNGRAQEMPPISVTVRAAPVTQ
jgi:hypothetical protein